MFDKILIANRGEIALRVIRACQEMGIKTLAVYSEADVDSLHVQRADEAICIGPAASTESYLKIDRIISAAEVGDVDAIHPGYGFLAENPHFAEVCDQCKIKFIGPSAASIRAMADKAVARESARKAGVPIVPGSDGPVETEADALRVAKKLGYPLIIKAVAGGGGRGMREAHNDVSLVKAFHTARMEAERAFKDAAVYIEKLIVNPRHVEIQIMADSKGNVVHLGERDCSIQRNHQKVIEESPSPFPGMTDDLRKKMGKAAIKLAEAAKYENAGTVEFLLDEKGNFYFIEMNTRIQVEHPVTEEVYGVDLVKEQIRVAAGQKLSFEQKNLVPRGHAIECRINAEDPYQKFRPCPGQIELFYPAGGYGVRVDSHAYSGYVIPPHYDSMIGKLVVFGKTRREALDRMSRVLDETIVRGIKTTVPFCKSIMLEPDFRAGKFGTAFVDQLLGGKPRA
ncbi:MAG: acetyl-CoA carboxylase biotin carboxylase subunit [Verrucomicrobiae bacterium]|nr:acetyl-CoA carboxylase biotin carboxylase subunit [Verrucomicrobiae bacterium]